MDDDLQDIRTGNGYDRDQAATANDRLKKSILATRKLHEVVAELSESIKGFRGEASRQTSQMIVLTRWIVGLTIVLVVGLIIQILLALKTL